MTQAMQCIPEFYGDPEQLQSFMYQLEFFANEIPAGTPQAPLLNVVNLKLKGAARSHAKRIQGANWGEVKEALKKNYRTSVSLEDIMRRIETLAQAGDESFEQYARRAMDIKEYIDVYEPRNERNEETYSERCLKIHFVGGLRNGSLKELAKSNRHRNLTDLTEYLEDAFIECEQLEEVERNLKNMQMGERLRQSNKITREENFKYRQNNQKYPMEENFGGNKRNQGSNRSFGQNDNRTSSYWRNQQGQNSGNQSTHDNRSRSFGQNQQYQNQNGSHYTNQANSRSNRNGNYSNPIGNQWTTNRSQNNNRREQNGNVNSWNSQNGNSQGQRPNNNGWNNQNRIELWHSNGQNDNNNNWNGRTYQGAHNKNFQQEGSGRNNGYSQGGPNRRQIGPNNQPKN